MEISVKVPADRSCKRLQIRGVLVKCCRSYKGVIVDGLRDEDGAFDLDAEFTVFTTDDNPGGEFILINGANCHAEIL